MLYNLAIKFAEGFANTLHHLELSEISVEYLCIHPRSRNFEQIPPHNHRTICNDLSSAQSDETTRCSYFDCGLGEEQLCVQGLS